MTKRSWSLSLAIHGLILGCLIALAAPPAKRPEPLRWEVALISPTPLPQPQSQSQFESAQRLPPPAVVTQAVQPATSAVTPLPAPDPAPRPAIEPSMSPPTPQPTLPATRPTSPPISPVSALSPASVVPVEAQATPPTSTLATEAAAPRPAPPPAERVDTETQSRWHALLAAKLAELKRYPLAARRLGQEGVVTLEASIHPDGRAEASVRQGSGYPALDRAALNLFQEAVSALSDRLAPNQISRLQIPIAYRLEH